MLKVLFFIFVFSIPLFANETSEYQDYLTPYLEMKEKIKIIFDSNDKFDFITEKNIKIENMVKDFGLYLYEKDYFLFIIKGLSLSKENFNKKFENFWIYQGLKDDGYIKEFKNNENTIEVILTEKFKKLKSVNKFILRLNQNDINQSIVNFFNKKNSEQEKIKMEVFNFLKFHQGLESILSSYSYQDIKILEEKDKLQYARFLEAKNYLLEINKIVTDAAYKYLLGITLEDKDYVFVLDEKMYGYFKRHIYNESKGINLNIKADNKTLIIDTNILHKIKKNFEYPIRNEEDFEFISNYDYDLELKAKNEIEDRDMQYLFISNPLSNKLADKEITFQAKVEQVINKTKILVSCYPSALSLQMLGENRMFVCDISNYLKNNQNFFDGQIITLKVKVDGTESYINVLGSKTTLPKLLILECLE